VDTSLGEDQTMTRYRTPRFRCPLLLLRDALGRFMKLRRPLAPPKVKQARARRPTLPVFVQLQLDLS